MNDLAKLILRITFGGLMITHGYPKLLKFFAEGELSFSDPLGVGPHVSLGLTVFAELVCAIFVFTGFKTRIASIPLIITMVVAAFIIHAGDPVNSREKALLYLAGFIAIAIFNSGKYSLDYLINKKV